MTANIKTVHIVTSVPETTDQVSFLKRCLLICLLVDIDLDAGNT